MRYDREASMESIDIFKQPTRNERVLPKETKDPRSSCFSSSLNPLFLLTPTGILKISQIVAAGVSTWMMLHLEPNNLSTRYMFFIGFSFYFFLLCLSSCMALTAVLLLCYVLSKESFTLVRSTVFELLFNGSAACLYLGLFGYLCYTLNIIYYIFEKLEPGTPAYPALVVAEKFSFVLGVLYIADAAMALMSYSRHIKSLKRS